MVPGPWQAQFADLRHASGRAVYRRRFPMPQGTGQVVLRFGAVSYFAEVRVNGALIGTNDNGWLPFDCDVPRHLLKQDNELEVLCLLPDGDPATSPDAPFAEIPHGKQSWYGPTGGIWQSVTLELRDSCHLNRAAISADSDGQMGVALHVSPGAGGALARLAILAPDGMRVAQETVPATASVTQANLMVTNPQLWSPDAPNI
jgi:beta-galactosidase/beta-glucuronidase